WQSSTWNVAMPALAVLSLLVALLAGFWAMSLNRQIAQLQEQNLALGRELTRQAEAMAALSGELAPVREENTRLRDEVAAQAKTLAALNEAMAPLQEENAALKQDVANQAQQLAALNQAISQPQTANVVLPETVAGLEQELAAQREQLDALNNQVAELQAVNANLGQELSTQRAVMAEVTSPDVQAMKIAGTETLPGAQGQLIANPVDDQAVLIVSGLPPLEPGLIYQFWLVQNGQLMRAGVFRADESGLGLLQVTTTTAIGSYEAMGVSVEPANSSGEPTNEMIMLGNFSS
ncbi:MAG TPA: anti-sigma factor, partial [Anaerolineae bacterium]|nr:anti-sigma factor [Anaerolineae bacterium]